jgi:hypothetical protein
MKKYLIFVPIVFLIASGCTQQSSVPTQSSSHETLNTTPEPKSNPTEKSVQPEKGYTVYKSKLGYSLNISKDFTYNETLSNLIVIDPRLKERNEFRVSAIKSPKNSSGKIITNLAEFTKEFFTDSKGSQTIETVNNNTTMDHHPAAIVLLRNTEVGTIDVRNYIIMNGNTFYTILFYPSDSMDFEGMAGSFHILP